VVAGTADPVAVGLLLWGLGLRVVFDAIDSPVGVGRSVVLSLAGTALNAVTPFGQIGGDGRRRRSPLPTRRVLVPARCR
jgi:uncharacterized membrane protein YbhN (UPF0104 family)